MKPKYRVIKHSYYEKCNFEKEYFTVQKEVKFLGIKMWKDIKEEIVGYGEFYKIPMKFDTESDAIYAIKKLENGALPEGWKTEITSVLDFNRKYEKYR